MEEKNPYHNESMWKGAPASSFSKAIYLRRKCTNAESILWEKLKNNQLDGLKFRRQHPISLFIADFYCHKMKLIIELDGGYHFEKEQIKKDKERTEILESNGLRVIRFSNEEVENNVEFVLKKIRECINEIGE